MSNNASTKIRQALRAAEDSLNAAKAHFDTQSNSLQAKASNAIDLFGGSVTSQLSDIVATSRKICDTLYAACQTQVKILDEICRPLLVEKPELEDVGDVWRMICTLNEESEITNNFTASLNSSSLGDVATAAYRPMMECKMIESYWESKYHTWPGYAEQEKKHQQEQQQKQKEKQATAANKAKEEKRAYEQALVQWEEAEKQISLQRQLALQQALGSEEESLKQKARAKFENTVSKCETQQETHLQSKEAAEEKLLTLKFYYLSEKSRLRKLVREADDGIQQCQQQMESAKKDFEKELSNLQQRIAQEKEKLSLEINNRYPLPRKPRMPLSMKFRGVIPPYALVAEEMKKAILETLVANGRMSYDSLAKRCPALQDMTYSYINGWLKALVNEGEITETKCSTKTGPKYYYDLAY